jgi:hypothetical protein
MTDNINAGDKDCKHVWVAGVAYNGDVEGTFHLRKAICSVCGLCEIQQQMIYSHTVELKKDTYELAKEKLNPSYLATNEKIPLSMLQLLEVSGAISAGDEQKVEEPLEKPKEAPIEPAPEEPVIEEPVEP